LPTIRSCMPEEPVVSWTEFGEARIGPRQPDRDVPAAPDRSLRVHRCRPAACRAPFRPGHELTPQLSQQLLTAIRPAWPRTAQFSSLMFAALMIFP
jgi:hypothetical protein